MTPAVATTDGLTLAPARWPGDEPLAERLLTIDPRAGRFGDARVADLAALLRRDDLLIVNDAATLPASLAATGPTGALEVRLLRQLDGARFLAVLFGEGDWRTPTEHRPPPPPLVTGDALRFAGGLGAVVEREQSDQPRLRELRFDREGAALWMALYRAGRPVQYAYLRGALSLWHVQTGYAARPWAMEMPSAGRPLRPGFLLALRKRGVRVARLTHGAGLSSTGDPALDAALPLRERYDIPEETIAEIARARAAGGRIIAAGTTVVRALEGCAAAHGGALVAGEGETELRLDRAFQRRVADGLLTGLHEPTASHFELLHAFAPAGLLRAAYAHAATQGYRCHEFGDSCLIVGG